MQGSGNKDVNCNISLRTEAPPKLVDPEHPHLYVPFNFHNFADKMTNVISIYTILNASIRLYDTEHPNDT